MIDLKKLILVFFVGLGLQAQELEYKTDSAKIRSIFTYALTEGQAYKWLDHLSNNIGGRLAGSEADKKAVLWSKKQLEKLDLDSVWLQEVKAP